MRCSGRFTLDGYCIECPGTCSECSGPYNCTQCKTPTFLTAHGTCDSSCQEGYYSEAGRDVHTYWGLKVGGTCNSCPENCNRCLGSGCLECNKFTYLDANGECVERCPDGYFGSGTDELGRVCSPCSASHGVCLNSTYVLECGDNTYLDPWNLTCLGRCPNGYFGLEGEAKEENGPKIGGTCEKCLGSCKTCSSSTVCQVCWDGSYLNPRTGRCSMVCPRDHYMSGTGEEGRECKPCPLTAGRCVNETYIYECRGDNQYLIPGGATTIPSKELLAERRNCTSACPDGYYGRPGMQLEEDGPLIGGTCEQCVGNCKLCKSATECLQCKGGTYFDPVAFKCDFQCPSDHYMTGFGQEDRLCKPCAPNAAACLNDTFATQCRGDQQYLVPSGGRCTSSCPEGYFGRPGVEIEPDEPLIGGTCDLCVAPCESCLSATECASCQGGTYLNPYDGSCRFDCPPDTYMKGTGDVGRLCVFCPFGTYGCLNETYALSCRGDNYYLTPQHTCENECPDGYYKSPGIAEYEGGPMIGGTCRKCVNNCKTCYSVNHCTSCRSGAYFNARDEKCDFTCPEDMYLSGDGEEGRECKQCPAKFHTCINEERASHCKGDNLYLTNKGECVSTCPVGSWRRTSNFTASNGMLVGGTCELCVADCRECLTNKECTVCENKMLLRNGTCEAKCPDGFWEKAGKNGVNGTCEHCSIGTKKCAAPQKAALISSLIDLGDGAEPQAVECDPGVELQNGECVNPCPSGKYKDPDSDKCVSCPGNCTTCMTADKCTECGPGAYLDKSLLPNVSVCRSDCPDGFYTNGREGANGGRCLACSTSCLQCSDRDQCLLCKDMRYLAQDISSGAVTCEDTCPDGFYPNGTKAIGRTCPMCGQNCKTCLSAGQCALCNNGKYLIADGWCEDGCPDGYYRKGDGDTGRTCEMCPGDFFTCVSDKIGDLGRHCLPCGQNCASCLEGDLCLQCTDSRYLSPDGWCEASCPDGYYKNGTAITGRNCAACPTNAMSCLSPSVITECKNFKYLTAAGTCEDACLEGTYPEGRGAVGRSCQVCHGNCEVCTQANACQRCKNGLYLSRDQWCEVSCPDGYYRNGTEDVGRSCLRCPDSAMKCIGPALITECRDWLYLTPDGTCSSSCPEGTYPHGANSVGRRCESCVNDCVHCTRDNVCLQCRNSKYLTPDFWCEATCPPGSWKNYSGAVGSRCEVCPGDFGACITPAYATECKNSKYLTHEATCQDACPNGYFPKGNGDVGRHCPQCHDDCYSCSTSNVCTVCDNGKFLSPNMWCDETCPDGYYRNGTAKIGNTCPQCPKHASKCINGTHTIECKDSRYLNPDFTCEVDCPRGMYQNGVTSVGRVCSLCAENCTLCVNGTTCTECRNNRYLTPEFWCEEECPSDHYYQPAPSLQEIEWKKLPDQSCGGSRITTWSGGGDAQYGEQYVDNLAGCQLLCMARAECAGFELREDINRCSFWKAAPLSPKAAKGVHCYRKMRLAPKKSSSPASEVVLPAWGKASMSSSLETTLPSHCNDGLVATRCSSMWNEAAGELTPWWQMDLEDSETIVKIRILSDPDGCEALSDEETGLHCSILGGVVGVSDTPCAAGKNCSGTVCGTLKETGDDKWFEIDCDRASGRYVYLQLPGYRVLNFRELVAYKVAESESCVETWQTTNVLQTGDTFAAANQELARDFWGLGGGASFAVAGPVASVSFKPGQDDRPVWVGLTTDPTDERDYQDGKYIHLTPKGSIAIDGALPSMTYTTEDYFRLELKGKQLIIFKSGAAIHTYDLGSSTSLHGWYALIWFGPTGANEPAASIEQVQTGCVPPQEGVGGTCVKCPGHASRCVNGSIALECKNDMYLRRTHDCAPECPHGDYPTDGWYGVGGYCTQCHENCNLCVNATTCLECKNQHYLTHDFKCVPECAKGYYEVKGEKWDDGLGGSCKQCHENCSACNSDTECTECRLFTYRTDSATCTDTCPDTYYKNGTEMIGGECLPCGENCFECESDVTCKVCNSSFFLARTGECVEHCPDGDYEVGDEEYGRQCMKCPDDFNKCITATYASECKNNLYLNADAECVISCPEGYFHRPLHSKPVGNECPVCPGNCNKCEDASTCTECKNTMYLNPDFWCEPECPIGYYKVGNAEIGNTCAKCPANCRTCIDGETCTECTNFKYLTPNRDCVEVCPNNTFPQGEAETGRACPHCEKNCHICESATLCLQCNNSMHLDDMDNCVVTCPDGYYPEGAEDRGRTCESCPMSYCGICTGPDVCLECTESRYLNPDSTCKTECCPPLYAASSQGHLEVVRLLLEANADKDKATNDGYTPLFVAAEQRHLEVLRFLLEAKADKDKATHDGFTPWCFAVQEGHLEVVGLLLDAKADMNTVRDTGSTPLTIVAEHGYLEVARLLLEAKADTNKAAKADKNKAMNDGTTPLVLASQEGQLEMVCLLLEANAEKDKAMNDGVTPLIVAAEDGHLDVVAHLLQRMGYTFGRHADLQLDRAGEGKTTKGSWRMGNTVGRHADLVAAGKDKTTKNDGSSSSSVSKGKAANEGSSFTSVSKVVAAWGTPSFGPDGFYRYGEEETGRICPRCFHTCNKCDSADICKECKNSTYLTPDAKCNYECPPGYYEHGTEEVGGLCKLCSDNCVECTGALVCEVCKNNYFLDPTSSTCKTSCPAGWYENIPDETVDTGRTCMQCPAPCNTCNSANECTECKDSAFLTPFGTCEYTCPPGLYPFGVGEINITCQPCSSNCDTCDTYEVCTACKNDKFLNPDGVCRDICPDGYWQLPVWGGVGNSCPLCAENCSLCTSPTVCQECRNSTYLSHYHWCEEECQDGYYEQGVDDLGRVCKICPPTCNKCEAEDHCTECKFSTFLTHYQACETTCPPGYYPNRTRDVGGVCETCPDECTQCSTASTCSECRNGLYLTPNGWCEEACPEGHYALEGTGGVGGTCPMCPENCHACNSAEECTVCRGFTHLTEYSQCRSECPNGYYENGTDSIGGGCNRCPSPCNLCETANVCTECAEASYLTPTGACEYKCPDRYHFEGSEDIGRFCKACPPTCFNCLSQEQCTLCQNFTFLTPEEKCEYTCPDGTYRDGIKEIGNTCPPCPKDMKRCISDTYATECSNKKYLTPSAMCDEGCPDGYYRHGDGEVGRTCPMCAQNCTVCTNATTCQGCKNGQYLTHTHWCDHECPDGYYKSGTGDQGRICKVCHSSCNTCLGPEVCTECKQGTYLAPDGSCKLDCPEGYYKLPGSEGVGGTCRLGAMT
eukprot:s231_g1.t1